MSNPRNQNRSQDEISEIASLVTQAQNLAKEWEARALRGHRRKAKAIRQKYNAILDRLYKELKWDKPLEIDDELITDLMPEYYLKLFPHHRYDVSFGSNDFVEYYDNLYKKTGNEFYNLHSKKDEPDDSE